MTAGNESMEALRHRQRLEARAAEEEDLMVRVPLSKEQRKQLKADRRHNLSGAAMMNDFADDVADLVGVSLFKDPLSRAAKIVILTIIIDCRLLQMHGKLSRVWNAKHMHCWLSLLSCL